MLFLGKTIAGMLTREKQVGDTRPPQILTEQLKQITKKTIMEMMEEELEKYNSERSITKSDIKKMMEEELSAIQQEGVSEARKRPLKRDRDAFDRNTQMVSDLQKTISSFLKETGAKLNQNHMNVIETMSTRLMHIANSPMIRLQEGDATSRMITKLEDIGSMIQEAISYSQDPEAIERLERAEQLVTELFEDMHSLL